MKPKQFVGDTRMQTDCVTRVTQYCVITAHDANYTDWNDLSQANVVNRDVTCFSRGTFSALPVFTKYDIKLFT